MRSTTGAKGMRGGFTLIEILVAVMLISVVIGALLQLYSNNTRFFSQMGPKMERAYQTTLLQGVTAVGFESGEIGLDELVNEFKVDDDLRRRLKSVRARVDYTELMRLDDADISEEAEAFSGTDEVETAAAAAEAPALEIGRTSLSIEGIGTSLIRVKLQ